MPHKDDGGPPATYRKTLGRKNMWRNDWLASWSLRAELLFPIRPCPGKDVGMDRRNRPGPTYTFGGPVLGAMCGAAACALSACASRHFSRKTIV